MQIPALKEYILVDATSFYIQAIRKQEDGSWKFEDIRDVHAPLRISTTGKQILLQDIYSNVKF